MARLSIESAKKLKRFETERKMRRVEERSKGV
jgi:hypothetical protein